MAADSTRHADHDRGDACGGSGGRGEISLVVRGGDMMLKVGVTLTVTPQIDRMIRVAEVAFSKVMGAHFQVVITSGNDGTHMAGSLHYQNAALDFRTGHAWVPPLMTEEEAQELHEEYKALLGAGYDVVLEKDHLHAEYDHKHIIMEG